MSLSQDPVLTTLKNQFVCGVSDISGKEYSGESGSHSPTGKAFFAGNGAGPHNVQLLILSSDGTVLHALPGYWHPQDLAGELAFAQQLDHVWRDSSLTREHKEDKFRAMQLAHIKEHSSEMHDRSRMQGFDMHYEGSHKLAASDTICNAELIDAKKGHFPWQAFKTTDRIMHERMAKQPFKSFDEFDIAKFSDYGQPRYDMDEEWREATGDYNKTLHVRNPNPQTRISAATAVRDYRNASSATQPKQFIQEYNWGK